jgi:ferredoxin
MSARLAIDWTRCDGHGLCAALNPERFRLDEWGFPVLTEPTVRDDAVGDVRPALNACPALALRLERTHR